MKRSKGLFFEKLLHDSKRVIGTASVSDEEFKRMNEVTDEFLKKTKIQSKALVMEEEALWSFLNSETYTKVREQVQEGYSLSRDHLGSYRTKYDDYPMWMPQDLPMKEIMGDEINIYYYFFRVNFMCDYVMSEEQKREFRLNEFDYLVLCKLIFFVEAGKSISITSEQKAMLRQFRADAVGAFIRHISTKVLFANYKRILGQLEVRASFPVEIDCRLGRHQEDDMDDHFCIMPKHYDCECEECSNRTGEHFSKEISYEDEEELVPKFVGERDDISKTGPFIVRNGKEIKTEGSDGIFYGPRQKSTPEGRYVPPVTFHFYEKFVCDQDEFFIEEEWTSVVKYKEKKNEFDLHRIVVSIFMCHYGDSYSAVILSRVCKAWYAATDSIINTYKYATRRKHTSFVRLIPCRVDRYRLFCLYLRQKGYTFDMDIVSRFIHLLIVACGSTMTLTCYLDTFWDKQYTCTGFVLILVYVLMKRMPCTKNSVVAMRHFKRIYLSLRHKTVKMILRGVKHRDVGYEDPFMYVNVHHVFSSEAYNKKTYLSPEFDKHLDFFTKKIEVGH